MSVTTTFATDILALILNDTPIANIADSAVSSPITSWYVSLHTASPGAAGTQATSEAAYTGYARIEVTRDTDGFSVAAGVGTNVEELTFGQVSANPGSDISHVGFGTASSGDGALKIYGALSSSIVMQVGTVPIFDPTELDFTCS